MAQRKVKKPIETWVIARDEFHPNPAIAAVYADVESRKSQERYLEKELERLTRTGPANDGEIAARRHTDNVAHMTRELQRVRTEMAEAKEAAKEKDAPTADELGGAEDEHQVRAKQKRRASLSSRISRAKKDGDDAKVAELTAERDAL